LLALLAAVHSGGELAAFPRVFPVLGSFFHLIG
jgi:hypothetical protein